MNASESHTWVRETLSELDSLLLLLWRKCFTLSVDRRNPFNFDRGMDKGPVVSLSSLTNQVRRGKKKSIGVSASYCHVLDDAYRLKVRRRRRRPNWAQRNQLRKEKKEENGANPKNKKSQTETHAGISNEESTISHPTQFPRKKEFSLLQKKKKNNKIIPASIQLVTLPFLDIISIVLSRSQSSIW